MTTVSIYGFIRRNGEIVYVGQTINLSQRLRAHLGNKNMKVRSARCVVLRTCDMVAATRIEAQIIEALWNKGQCQLNRRLPLSAKVVCLKTGTIWKSQHAAAKFFNCHSGTIRNAVYNFDGEMRHGGIEYRLTIPEPTFLDQRAVK